MRRLAQIRSINQAARAAAKFCLGAGLLALGLTMAPVTQAQAGWHFVVVAPPVVVGPPAYYYAPPPPAYYYPPPPAYYPPYAYDPPPPPPASPPPAGSQRQTPAQPQAQAQAKTPYGGTCYAGVYVCPTPYAQPVGSDCACPGLGALSYGKVN